MKLRSSAFQVATVLAILVLVLGATARPASAGLFGPRTVIVNPGYPVYAAPAPVVATYAAPVSTVVTSPVTTVYSSPVVGSAPLVDQALVPTTYTAPVVGAAPVTSTYIAPAVVAPAARVRVVYPRRAYRYYYGY